MEKLRSFRVSARWAMYATALVTDNPAALSLWRNERFGQQMGAASRLSGAREV